MVNHFWGTIMKRKYVQTNRAFQKYCRDLVRTQSDIEKFEAREEKTKKKERGRKARRKLVRRSAYYNRDDAGRRQQRRHKKRRTSIPADRRCPTCGALKFKSRQWVVHTDVCMCLSCWRKR